MKKDRTRIERTFKGKIKQYTPAKLERLRRYFAAAACEQQREGPYVSMRFNGGPVYRLRIE